MRTKRNKIENLLIALSFIFILACSSDDSEDKTETSQGGTITQLEFVEIEIDNLTQTTYQANIDGVDIELEKTKPNTLGLYVDMNLPIGDVVLEIPGLNKNINYTIEEIELLQSVDETISTLSTDLQEFSNNIVVDSPEKAVAKGDLEEFINGLSTLDSAEKENLAIFYQANSAYFQDIFLQNQARPLGKSNDNLSHNELVLAFLVSSAFASSTTWGAGATLSTPIVSGLLTIVSGVAWATSINLFFEIVSNKLKSLNIKFNAVEGALNRSQNAIPFNSGEEQVVTFQIQNRSLNSEDSSDSTSLLSQFFDTFSDINSFIDTANEAIDWANENIPFIDKDHIDYLELEETQGQYQSANEAIYNNTNFNINHEQVFAQSIAFTNEGLEMKIAIDDDYMQSMEEDYLDFTIDYSYSDSFSNFSGSIPAQVYKEDLEIDLSGNWIMAVSGGKLFGTYDDEAALYRFEFGGNSITFNQVTIISDGFQDDGSEINAAFSNNSYTLNGSQLNIQFSGDGEITPSCFDEETEEWVDYSRLFSFNFEVNTEYNTDSEEFSGSVNEIIDYAEGPIIPCESTEDYDGTSPIQIYREE